MSNSELRKAATLEFEEVASIHLYYETDDNVSAGLVRKACLRSIQILRQNWKLTVPSDCRVYVIGSWFRSLLHSAPWEWKPLLLLSLPVILIRFSKIWPFTGGMAVPMGRRKIIGIKSISMMEASQPGLGDRIFTAGRSIEEKVETVLCHELTHAFTFQLKLPAWLNEGLALLAMEKYSGRPLIKRETLEILARNKGIFQPGRPEKLQTNDPDALLGQYIQGYWFTRYIQENRPTLMAEILAERRGQEALLTMIPSAFEKSPEAFWGGIQKDTVAWFDGERVDSERLF